MGITQGMIPMRYSTLEQFKLEKPYKKLSTDYEEEHRHTEIYFRQTYTCIEDMHDETRPPHTLLHDTLLTPIWSLYSLGTLMNLCAKHSCNYCRRPFPKQFFFTKFLKETLDLLILLGLSIKLCDIPCISVRF